MPEVVIGPLLFSRSFVNESIGDSTTALKSEMRLAFSPYSYANSSACNEAFHKLPHTASAQSLLPLVPWSG